jgi:uncharacterized protein YciI
MQQCDLSTIDRYRAITGDRIGAPSMLSRPFLKMIAALTLVSGAPMYGVAEKTQQYFVTFLRPHPGRKALSKQDSERIQAAHMANIHKMAQSGDLVSAGPFADTPTTISGMFIFKVDSLQEAQAIAAQDPTIVEHRNTVDTHAWDGPPEIGVEYKRLHELDPKTPENMQPHPLCLVYRGSAWSEKQSTRPSLMVAHAEYVRQLRKQGKLSAAGAIAPPDNLLGMIVFRPLSLTDAKQALEKDPAVAAGLLHIEYHVWWSSDHVLPW